MSLADDLTLLHRYARDGCEDCFTELVNRHLDLVYSAALRQVRSPELAQEVAQSVFIELSRSAGKIKPGSVLPAWLYEVTRRRAIDVVRRESRRQLREQIACENNAMNAPASDWSQIEPLLDEAMDSLDEADRAAILLRYFENKSLREVGEALGASEDAAQKRVTRAVDRLRDYFTRRKIPIAAVGLAAVISANAVEAAPAGLSATISASALAAGAAAHTAALIGVTKAIAMTTIQKALIAAVITTTLGTGIYEANRASQLDGKVRALQQRQQQTSDQGTQSAQALDDAMKKLAALQSENDQLRAQVTSLKASSEELVQMKSEDDAASKDPTQRAMLSWLDRVDRLKQHMQQMPNESIPEMQYLTDEDWLNATQGKLDTDAQYRRAMSTLRSAAENEFSTKLQPALQRYMAANNNQFPTDITQLQPFFNPPIDPAILQRYEVAPASTVPNVTVGGDSIITQKAAVDDEYDGRTVIGPGGSGSLEPIPKPLFKW
jgi:RNA polymerase sigma factor (sigma-70 family)